MGAQSILSGSRAVLQCRGGGPLSGRRGGGRRPHYYHNALWIGVANGSPERTGGRQVARRDELFRLTTSLGRICRLA